MHALGALHWRRSLVRIAAELTHEAQLPCRRFVDRIRTSGRDGPPLSGTERLRRCHYRNGPLSFQGGREFLRQGGVRACPRVLPPSVRAKKAPSHPAEPRVELFEGWTCARSPPLLQTIPVGGK